MGEKYKQLSDSHIKFISKQSMFFVGTAAAQGLINVSPKGMDTFRVIDESKVIWLNLTGSGNESATHVAESNRMTIMFCSFDIQPMILRLFGEASVIHPRDERWNELIDYFPAHPGARQIFELDINMVLRSCGFGVPLYELKGERSILSKWAEDKGQDGIEEYWRERNQESLEHKSTGIMTAEQTARKPS